LLVSAADTADLWLAENDPQGVAFENEVLVKRIERRLRLISERSREAARRELAA
jgi:hypothetical protein